MRKNPFSRMINHKILHKIGKQWVVLSTSLLILLSGATAITHADMVRVNKTQPKAAKVVHNSNVTTRAEHLHQTLLRTSAKSSHKPVLKNKSLSTQAHQTHEHIYPSQIAKQKVMTFYRSRSYHTRKTHKHYVKHSYHHRTSRKHYVKPARHYIVHRHSYFGETLYRHPWQTYLTETKGHQDYAFTNHELRNLKNNNSDSYNTDYSDLYDPSPEHIRVYGRTYINHEKFYNVYLPSEGNDNYWVIANEVSHNRRRRYNKNQLTNFFNHEDNQFINRHYFGGDREKVYNLRDQYNYLMKYENSSNTNDMATFREHVIDWINFWRSDIYNLSPVSENSNYDDKAQEHADTQSDPEDMDWGSTNPANIVSDYVTDANDADNSGEPGHRYSVLNPKADQVGTGQNGDVNGLFFDWGEDGSHNSDSQYEYPSVGSFPYSDATIAQYWSLHSPYLHRASQVTVDVNDETDNDKIVNVSNVYLNGNNVAFKIDNKNDIKNGHKYYVRIYVPGDGSQPTYWYYTTMFNINPHTHVD